MHDSPQRFLAIRLSSIGDIVHALPAVAALGSAYPESEIHWVVEARYAPLLEGNPFVRKLVRLDTLEWRKEPLSAGTLVQIAQAGAMLREVTYQAAIDFQGLFKSAFLGWFSRSEMCLGLSEPWLREPPAGVFYTDRVTPRDRQHVIELNMALVERLGVRPLEPDRWQFPLPRPEAEERWVDCRLRQLGVRDFAIINPGGGWKSKRWAPENYAELIRKLTPDLPWHFLLTGSVDEEPLIQRIVELTGAERAVYFPSTLVQYIQLARRARLFVGGDTGPMHLAAAVGTPIVALFSADDPRNTPERNGPFSSADIVVTSRDAARPTRSVRVSEYLRGVGVEDVVRAVRERLARAYG